MVEERAANEPKKVQMLAVAHSTARNDSVRVVAVQQLPLLARLTSAARRGLGLGLPLLRAELALLGGQIHPAARARGPLPPLEAAEQRASQERDARQRKHVRPCEVGAQGPRELPLRRRERVDQGDGHQKGARPKPDENGPSEAPADETEEAADQALLADFHRRRRRRRRPPAAAAADNWRNGCHLALHLAIGSSGPPRW
mmetsp:Transcript_68427/g.177725  ORF Transcript_68427/g.177725 Transcript_68427/m.177725 type:complete len:200 (+) Transcript_68427:630-1229(+)